jgi:hypothetical protein
VWSEDDLVDAAAVAAGYSHEREQVAAVLPVELRAAGGVALCALRRDEDPAEVGWIAVGRDGRVVRRRDVVHDAASLAALCEAAADAALAADACEIAATAGEAAARAARLPQLESALRDVERAAATIAASSDGLRVARVAYVDELAPSVRALADAAGELQREGQALSATLADAGGPDEALAREVWGLVARLAAGRPDRYADRIAQAAGAVDALADDVVAAYRLPLETEPHGEGT